MPLGRANGWYLQRYRLWMGEITRVEREDQIGYLRAIRRIYFPIKTIGWWVSMRLDTEIDADMTRRQNRFQIQNQTQST